MVDKQEIPEESPRNPGRRELFAKIFKPVRDSADRLLNRPNEVEAEQRTETEAVTEVASNQPRHEVSRRTFNKATAAGVAAVGLGLTWPGCNAPEGTYQEDPDPRNTTEAQKLKGRPSDMFTKKEWLEDFSPMDRNNFRAHRAELIDEGVIDKKGKFSEDIDWSPDNDAGFFNQAFSLPMYQVVTFGTKKIITSLNGAYKSFKSSDISSHNIGTIQDTENKIESTISRLEKVEEGVINIEGVLISVLAVIQLSHDLKELKYDIDSKSLNGLIREVANATSWALFVFILIRKKGIFTEFDKGIQKKIEKYQKELDRVSERLTKLSDAEQDKAEKTAANSAAKTEREADRTKDHERALELEDKKRTRDVELAKVKSDEAKVIQSEKTRQEELKAQAKAAEASTAEANARAHEADLAAKRLALDELQQKLEQNERETEAARQAEARQIQKVTEAEQKLADSAATSDADKDELKRQLEEERAERRRLTEEHEREKREDEADRKARDAAQADLDNSAGDEEELTLADEEELELDVEDPASDDEELTLADEGEPDSGDEESGTDDGELKLDDDEEPDSDDDKPV